MSHLKGKTEAERTKEFEDLVGITRADRLSKIWQNSYPMGTAYDKLFGGGKSKEQVFKETARNSGFWDYEIEAFLEL
jgi:hypothetical protein